MVNLHVLVVMIVPDPARADATMRRAFVGERMYLWYAKLLQWPAAWMSQAGSPAAAASVAAPILRLWPLYCAACSGVGPVASRRSRRI